MIHNKIKNNKSKKIFKFIVFIIIILIIKNIALFGINQYEINRLKDELRLEKSVNLSLIEEIKDIKTDRFVIRYAVDNLNLRPKEEDLIDLSITEEELAEVYIRIEEGKFGKKFENYEVQKEKIEKKKKELFGDKSEESVETREDEESVE